MMITKGEGMEPTSGAHLVDRAGGDLARARRARAGAARVGQVDALLLSLVQNVNVARALNLFAGALGWAAHDAGDGKISGDRKRATVPARRICAPPI